MSTVHIETLNQIEGFHRWPDAPEECGYLTAKHRHIFLIRCEFEVAHLDRDIELVMQQHRIAALIKDAFGFPAEFGACSCEQIALYILDRFDRCVKCSVLEDGMGGAVVRK